MPVNLLPAALLDVLHRPGSEQKQTSRPTVVFQNTEGQLQSEILTGVRAQNADLFEDYQTALKDRLEDTSLFIGPRIPNGDIKPTGALDILAGPSLRSSGGVAEDIEIGIIDAGIAFWNPEFRSQSPDHPSRFATLSSLSYNNESVVDGTTLEQSDLDDLMDQPDVIIRAHLARKFPTSVYGMAEGRPLFAADGLAHGTAMTDLVNQTAPQGARFHGLELPVAVLRDLTGGQMAVVMSVALRKIATQAASVVDTEFRMVVLMAFGFTGGPQDGQAEILAEMNATLDDLAAKGIFVTLVLPIGNHRQDQLHAQLGPNDHVRWRIQPDDYSANTVEFIQQAKAEPLTLEAPDGASIHLPTEGGISRLVHNGQDVGAVWVTGLASRRVRTRLTLTPTAAKAATPARAQAGAWTIRAKGSGADLWILRDETGFEVDLSKPSRASWFEDTNYRPTDALGRPGLEDQLGADNLPVSVIRRKGTASILATARHARIFTATAVVKGHGEAAYASQPMAGRSVDVQSDLRDTSGRAMPSDALPRYAEDGRAVLGNGSGRRFKAAGTSLAAALEAGRRAHPSP